MKRLVLAAALLPLAACGKADDPPAVNMASTRDPGGFVPPKTEAPTPLPGQAHNNPLTAYVGKYPGDTVGGVTFFDRTEVANALIAAVGDEKLRRMITARNAVTVPIFEVGGRIAAHGCEPHNCGDHNWTFLLAPDGTHAEACFHDAAAMGNTSRWYANSAPVVRTGNCPQA